MKYVDAHCHLNAHEFNEDIDNVISRAKSKGVQAAIVVTESVDDFERTKELVEQYPDWIFPCMGVHPVQGERSVTKADLDAALPLLQKHKHFLIGVGEVCLFIYLLLYIFAKKTCKN